MARTGVRLVLFLIIGATLVSMTAMVGMYFVISREPSVPSRATLVLRIGAIPELASTDALEDLLLGDRRPLALPEILGALEKAKTDTRIAQVLIVPSGVPQAFWGKLQEVRQAILDFRTSGKPAYAYLEYGGEYEYYLATATDRIFLMPSSPLDLTGLASYEVFLGGTFEKLGVEADLHHIGDYKSAPNQFTETTFTPAHREMSVSLNEDLFGQLVRDTATGRGKSEDEMRGLYDRGPFLAEAALAAGLVDEIAYEDQVEKTLAGDEDELTTMSGRAYAQVSPSSAGVRTGTRMGIVYVNGTIASGASGYDPLYGPVSGSDAIVRQLRRAKDDDSLSAIILRIDSPGGSAVASDVIWRELMLARDDKPDRPIVVSMSDLGASGGYYIATPAHAIVAEPGTLTGSIGIYGGKFITGGLYEKLGMNIEAITSGTYAEMNSPVRRYNDVELEKVEEQLNAFYNRFVQLVADGRNMSWDEANALAGGRVWTGHQAWERGLVDELGGLRTAINVAKQHAKIDEDVGVELVNYVASRDLLDVLLGQMMQARLGGLTTLVAGVDWLHAAATALAEAPRLTPLFRRGEAMALMPLTIGVQ